MRNREELAKEFAATINKYSAESGSNTPDFILGEYLVGCLETYNQAVSSRDAWYDDSESYKDVCTDPEKMNGAADQFAGKGGFSEDPSQP